MYNVPKLTIHTVLPFLGLRGFLGSISASLDGLRVLGFEAPPSIDFGLLQLLEDLGSSDTVEVSALILSSCAGAKTEESAIRFVSAGILTLALSFSAHTVGVFTTHSQLATIALGQISKLL